MQIKTKITTNVSFDKLLNKIPEILDVSLNRIANDSAKLSKSNINKSVDFQGTPLKGLSEASINTRNRGGLVGTNIPLNKRKSSGLNNIGGSKPLKYTGNLFNSIKANKNFLTMAGYAKDHFEGFTFTQRKQTGGVFKASVPPRPFIASEISKKTKDSFFKDLEKSLLK